MLAHKNLDGKGSDTVLQCRQICILSAPELLKATAPLCFLLGGLEKIKLKLKKPFAGVNATVRPIYHHNWHTTEIPYLLSVGFS